MAAWGPKRVVLLFPITKSCFELLKVHKSEDRGSIKMPYHFLFTFVTINQQIADLEKYDYTMEWPANQDKCLGVLNISVLLMGGKWQLYLCFVNKQLQM